MRLMPTISYLTDIYFDFGTISLLPELVKSLGIGRPLVITDEGLVKLGIVERLGIGEPTVFDRVETNPTEASAISALETFRAAECDGVVAVGGGSPMDLAKCVCLLVHHDPPLEQYAILRGGISRITSHMPRLIAVPTTAGSGSEVGRAALLTLPSQGKLGFLSPYLLPKAAICDPELTLSLPPLLTAATGMDAISHCVETYCSPRFNPVADSIALDGLKRGFHHILRATHDGADRQARTEMMLCSLQGGLAFQKGLGAVHSLSHPLGALTGKRLHHGTLNALFLPIVLRFNFDSCAEKMEAMARRLGLKNGAALPDRFARLNQELGLPTKLQEMGLTPEDLIPLAEKARQDHCTPTNPCPLELADLKRLYLAAWQGRPPGSYRNHGKPAGTVD